MKYLDTNGVAYLWSKIKEKTGFPVTVSYIPAYATSSTGTYKFNNTGDKFVADNYGKDSSTATTVLTFSGAGSITISLSIVTENNYDKVTIKHNSTTLANAISGTQNTTYNITVAANDTLTLTYAKDSSQSASGEKVEVTLTGTKTLNNMSEVIDYVESLTTKALEVGY